MALIPPPGSPIERAPRTDPEIDRDLREAQEREFEKSLLTTTFEKALHWAQASSVWPAIFGLARDKQWTLYELHQESGSLEDLFRDLTAGPTTS